MKKSVRALFSILSIICILLSTVTFSAGLLLGDIDENGMVEASDARTVLRASVGLEILDGAKAYIADTDKDGKITASDARIILRMSVGLDPVILEEHTEENDVEYEVHFIDVGQADCSLIISDGESMLIDGGNVADSSLVVSYLLAEGIEELDYVICTHAHEDHVGGLSGPLNKFTVTEAVFAPATAAETKCYKSFVDAVHNQGLEITVPEAGESFEFGDGTVTFVGPVTESYYDINNTSIVTKITFGETSFLFTGDAERESEADIIAAGFDLSATILKVGHHGSENSTSYPFLREIMPEIAVISVGTDNDYGHPTEAVLSRLRDAEVKVYRTDMQGHIIVKGNGKDFIITPEKNSNADTNPTIPPAENTVYIGNKNSKVLHKNSCSSLPKEENRVYFESRSQADLAGYSPCSRCKP